MRHPAHQKPRHRQSLGILATSDTRYVASTELFNLNSVDSRDVPPIRAARSPRGLACPSSNISTRCSVRHEYLVLLLVTSTLERRADALYNRFLVRFALSVSWWTPVLLVEGRLLRIFYKDR